MLRRLSLLVAIVLVACASRSASAQSSIAPRAEPSLTPGEIAVRLSNESDCVVLARARVNGEVTQVGAIPAHRTGWMHTRSVDGAVQEIEIVVSPRLCGLAPNDTTAGPAPRLEPVRKASWRRL